MFLLLFSRRIIYTEVLKTVYPSAGEAGKQVDYDLGSFTQIMFLAVQNTKDCQILHLIEYP